MFVGGDGMNKNITVLFLALFLLIFGVQLVKGSPQPVEANVYYVSVDIHKGDTLWDIAKEYKQAGQATKSYVKEIMRVNNMDGAKIRAGETLFVPIVKQAD